MKFFVESFASIGWEGSEQQHAEAHQCDSLDEESVASRKNSEATYSIASEHQVDLPSFCESGKDESEDGRWDNC